VSERPIAIVVEDSPHIAERVVEMLKAAGLEVLPAVATEDEALRVVDAHPIDFALIDLQLAQGTGFQVIRHLRANEGARKILIAVLTNHAVPALKVASFEAGADYFLDKSRDFYTVERLAREWMASRAPA
jgi:DNA-binding response OmpR family regulator